MSKINFLKPDKSNLQIFLYSGTFLFFISILDVFLNAFFRVNLTFFLPGFFGDLIPFFLFILASFTDYLDGLLARIFKEESKLGELLDPIADKIIVAAALVLLVMNDIIKNYA